MDAELKEKLRRAAAVSAPSLFTVGNMACGFVSALAASQDRFALAGWLILAGIVLDVMDGRVARLVHGESAFGVEFDSFSDFTTFCLAPGAMMYHFVLKDHGMWGAVVAFVYTLCGGLRLARFNIAAQESEGPKTHFTGLPTPAAAGLLASFIVLYDILEAERPARTIAPLMDQIPTLTPMMPFIMLGLALLMVSNIPYATFKQPHLLQPRSVRALLIAVSCVAITLIYPQNAIFLLFAVYVTSGLAAVAWRAFRSLVRLGRDRA